MLFRTPAPPFAPPLAIVVLGCRTGERGSPSAPALRRADRAALAYFELEPAFVIASGGRRWHGRAEADVFADALVARGVPRAAVVRELCSLSTIENAAYSREILASAGISAAAIVTCDFHMQRALACFRSVGVTAEPLEAPSPVSSSVFVSLRTFGERARGFLDRRAAGQWALG